MKKEISLALSAYLLLFITSFILSVTLGLGELESVHDPSSPLLYGRRCLMVLLAIAIPWFTRRQTLSALGWTLSIKWILITGVVGIAIGLRNKGGFNPQEPVAILLALFHTFATELFFRGYLFKTFTSVMAGRWLPLLLSSSLYGLSYLTVWTTWTFPVAGIIAFVLLFTFLGVVFAYSYKRSGSFLVPWMMHFLGVLQYRVFF